VNHVSGEKQALDIPAKIEFSAKKRGSLLKNPSSKMID
jgi:hypothetical protein